MLPHRIGNSVVKVIAGDICKSKCEVIVSSDDSRFTQGGGVSHAIACAGGCTIRDHARKLMPVDLGDVAVTSAGNLPQKYIFHAVTIDLEKLRVIDDELQDFIVRSTVRRCFQLMTLLKLSSIAFPVIGAGFAGIPTERVCCRMAEMFVEELGQMNRGLSVELWTLGVPPDLADSFICEIAKSGNRQNGGLISSARVTDVGRKIPTVQGARMKGCGKFLSDGSTYDVFISYSRSDSGQADWICSVLKSAGISYWRDVDGTYSGRNFKGVIARAIHDSHTVFFLSSRSSNESDNVVGEIGAAMHFRKNIVPIKLDDADYHDNLLMDMLYLDHIDIKRLGREKAAEKMCRVVLLNRANSMIKHERHELRGSCYGYVCQNVI